MTELLGTTAEEIERAVRAGVGRIVLDSFLEIVRVAHIAQSLGKRQRVQIRVTVGVEARRYAWAFRHPGGRATEGVLHIPAGRPVDLSITATDVIHSFWVPRLAGKMDAIPGHTNRLRIVASRPGIYRGECAEYCGTGHKDHGFTVVAHDAAGWSAFTGGRR